MNPKQLQYIKLTSLNAVQNLYTQDYPSVFPLLHGDVTWIDSADNQCLQGKAAVVELLSSIMPSAFPRSAAASFTAPPLSLSCRLLYSDLESCAVLCSCSRGLRQEYCATFLWKACREGLRIYHIHASASSSSPEPILSFTGQRSESYYIKPNDILYVEADNIYTSLICSTRTLKTRQSISAVKDILPDYFLQVHRSFLVNLHYTSGLRRYTLELTNGAQLPIPEKKYKWLKEYLAMHR